MKLFEKIFGKKVAKQIIPQSDQDYNNLLIECIEQVENKNKQLQKDYGFGTFERWDVDQEVGDLIFSDNGVTKLSTKVVFLGSYSESSETWLWGWANSSIMESLTEETNSIKEYGKQNSITDLVTPKTEATESEAWGLASLGCRILNGLGIYRAPTGNGYLFMMIKEINS